MIWRITLAAQRKAPGWGMEAGDRKPIRLRLARVRGELEKRGR